MISTSPRLPWLLLGNLSQRPWTPTQRVWWGPQQSFLWQRKLANLTSTFCVLYWWTKGPSPINYTRKLSVLASDRCATHTSQSFRGFTFLWLSYLPSLWCHDFSTSATFRNSLTFSRHEYIHKYVLVHDVLLIHNDTINGQIIFDAKKNSGVNFCAKISCIPGKTTNIYLAFKLFNTCVKGERGGAAKTLLRSRLPCL